MNAWLKNAIKNLLPLSKEKEDFTKALKEWSFSGETIDYEQSEEVCQLCEMEGLRYHYQISNNLKNVLWVGSKCIERFDILVLDEEGSEVEQTQIETYLKNKLKEKHVYEALIFLSQSHPNQTLKGHAKLDLDQYCITQMLKQNSNARILNYLFIRFEEENIYFNKRFFSINIRSKLNKDKFLSLNKIQFERIRGALSYSQIAYYQLVKN